MQFPANGRSSHSVDGSAAPVPFTTLLSADQRTLRIVPQSALTNGTTYTVTYNGIGANYTGSSFFVLFGDFASVYVPAFGTGTNNMQGHHGVVGYTGGMGPDITSTFDFGGTLNSLIRATGKKIAQLFYAHDREALREDLGTAGDPGQVGEQCVVGHAADPRTAIVDEATVREGNGNDSRAASGRLTDTGAGDGAVVGLRTGHRPGRRYEPARWAGHGDCLLQPDLRDPRSPRGRGRFQRKTRAQVFWPLNGAGLRPRWISMAVAMRMGAPPRRAARASPGYLWQEESSLWVFESREVGGDADEVGFLTQPKPTRSQPSERCRRRRGGAQSRFA